MYIEGNYKWYIIGCETKILWGFKSIKILRLKIIKENLFWLRWEKNNEKDNIFNGLCAYKLWMTAHFD